MPTKKVTRKNAKPYVKTNKTIRGGTVIGKGTFGVIMGNPSIPFEPPLFKVSKSISLLPSVGLKKASEKTKTNKGSGKINYLNTVSKLFFTETDIGDVLKTIAILSEVGGNGFQKKFDKYLVLPVDIPGIGYKARIDLTKYLSPEFQSDEYWSNSKKTVVDTDSRDKLSNSEYMVIYPKALFDVSNIELESFQNFETFLHNFRNIVAGVQLLHKNDIVHHDLKPGNMLVLASKTDVSKQKYKISDLDSMEFSYNFTNESEEQVSRLFNNWGYEYFPTCSTLLASTLAAKSSGTSRAQINGAVANTWISHGMERNKEDPNIITFNQGASKRIQKATLAFIQQIQRVLPDKASELSSILLDINSSKFGTILLDDDNLSDGGAGFNAQKYKVLADINSKIVGILNLNRKLNLDDKHIILVKYVDIYSLGVSLLEMTKKYITTTQEIFNDKMSLKIKKIFDFAAELLTYAYFDAETYNNDILSVYDESVLGKPPGRVASSRSKSSSNSSVPSSP